MDVAIGVIDGKVIARWHEMTDEIIFDPQNAYMVGMALSKAALEAHRGNGSPGDMEFIGGELSEVKLKVSDTKRNFLIVQVSSILRSLITQNKSPAVMAMHAVDAVLQETAR